MASNIPYPTDELVELAMSMTEYYDRDTLISALQAKNNDLQAVLNEWFDDPEKVRHGSPWYRLVAFASTCTLLPLTRADDDLIVQENIQLG